MKIRTRHEGYLLLLTIFAFQNLESAPKKAPNTVDHAGILQSLDLEDYAAGETIYKGLCTNCHGVDGVTPPLPTARAFGNGELKFGTDPYSMFLTLTNGNGLMGPQTWMTAQERYQVIHYIRQKFMKPMRKDYVGISDKYLQGLPKVEAVAKSKGKVERDFGPALASQLTREISSVLTVKLNADTTLSYNLHSMDQAGLWRGGFLNLSATQHYRERGGGVAVPDGNLVEGLQTWKWAHQGTLNYPTENLLPRGPMPADWMEYRGHYLHGDQVVLSYKMEGRGILETPSAPEGFGAVIHTFEMEPGKALQLCTGKLANAAQAFSGHLQLDAKEFELTETGGIAVLGRSKVGGFVAAAALWDVEGMEWSIDSKNGLVLDIPKDSGKRVFEVLRYAGKGEGELLAFANFVRSRIQKGQASLSPSSMIKGGKARWTKTLQTKGRLGKEDSSYTQDILEIPPNDSKNPYNTWFRTSALAFFPDCRMVISTHGGDIWIVSGIDDKLEKLDWKRFAAGLYEPFGLQVIDDLIYVTCKDRLTRLHDLNQDGEADFYESFSADDDVSVNFHAFNFDLQRDKAGNLYYAKSGQYTDYKLPGSIIKVSPDGKRREVYCTGFRTPNGMGILPDGRPTVSDNQGSWMPASKVSLCEPGGFYGYVQTFATGSWAPDGGKIDHTKVVPPKTFDQPLIWMPQHFDNSSGGQLWVDDPRWGPLSGKMLHTSFGKGWIYYFLLQEVDGVDQAAVVKMPFDAETGIHRARVNPADGQVYATGLNGWNGGGRKGLAQGGISRFRYTGAESKLLTGLEVTKEGIRLEFNFKLSKESASNPELYQLKQWNYLWAPKYGSAQYSLVNKWETGVDEVLIQKVVPGKDGKAVLLVISDIQPVNQVELNLNLQGADGSKFTEQVYLTINAVPGGKHPNMKELTKGGASLWEELKRKEAERKRLKQQQKRKKKPQI